MIRTINIPNDRVAVLIGKDGKVRKEIENKTKTIIKIGDNVSINGDALDVITAENIVKAIARGFCPKIAFLLLNENKILTITKISDDEKKLKRIRARLIGENGKVRKNLEQITKSKISIYGKTASIISDYDNIDIIGTAIEKLIKGESHTNVYGFLRKRYNYGRKKNSN